MTYCLTPDCQKPRNPDRAQVCRNCGSRLWLKDRYRAIAAIGQGGFGRTFLAIDEDKPSKPRCVIKQFLPIAQNPRSLKKAADLFAQEAMRLEELGHHPQIPELLAYFSQQGQQYLVQEFIDGKNLADLLLEQGAFTEAQIREVLSSLLPVLDFVHSHKVIHRDIKPGNLISTAGNRLGMGLPQAGLPDWQTLQQALSVETAQGFRNFVTPSYRFNELLSFSLTQLPRGLAIALQQRCQQLAMQFTYYSSLSLAQRQYLVADSSRLLYEIRQAVEATAEQKRIGRLVLVDFGAAKSVKGLEPMQTGTTIGSPEYVAPEQSRGKAVFASDLYSVGVTCIHLLTKVSPYDLFDPAMDDWIWRRYLTHPLSEKLGRILDRLLETAIARRYQTAAEVLQDLEGQGTLLTAQTVAQPMAQAMSAQAIAAPSATAQAIAAQANRSAPIPPLGKPMVAPPSNPPGPISGVPQVPSPQSFQPSFRIAPRVPVQPAPMVPAIATQPTELNAESAEEPKSRRRSLPTWKCIHTFDSPGRIYTLALSPTDSMLASSSGNTIKLWDLEKLQLLRTVTGHLDIIPALVISPDGKLMVSGSADKILGFWELPSGKRLSSLALHLDTVLALALTPDGNLLASSSFYDPITVLDLNTGQARHGLTGHTARVDTLAFSPDGTILASGSGDRTIKLWDMGTGNEIRTLEGHAQQISSLAFSPDGATLASGSWDGTVKLWNLRTRRQGRTLELESGRVNSLSFSGDGKKLAIASDSLQLWNLPSGKRISLEGGHLDTVSAIAFGATDQTLISAGFDRTIKIWRWE